MGASLTADYNMYALTMTAGGLAALSWLLSARSLPAKLLASGLLLSLLAAGFLSGSRRFWVVAPLMFALLVVSGIRREGSKRALGGVTVLLACLAALVALLYWFVPIDWAKLANTGWDLQYRLATLLDSGQSGGLEARFSRWQFATHMLTDYRVWIGSGFDYLAVYSCHFDDCVVAGYPHNPVISAWLYAGVAGALSVLALLGYFLYCGLQLLRGAMPLLGALLIAHLPFYRDLLERSFRRQVDARDRITRGALPRQAAPRAQPAARGERAELNERPGRRSSCRGRTRALVCARSRARSHARCGVPGPRHGNAGASGSYRPPGAAGVVEVPMFSSRPSCGHRCTPTRCRRRASTSGESPVPLNEPLCRTDLPVLYGKRSASGPTSSATTRTPTSVSTSSARRS